MPSNNGISFDAAGRVRIVDVSFVTAPLSHLGALAFDATESLLTVIAASAPDAVSGGWPFSPASALKIVLTDVALPPQVPLASLYRVDGTTQAVICTTNNPIASFSEGLPFDQFGNLCVVYAGAPPANRAFSNGFDLGFS